MVDRQVHPFAAPAYKGSSNMPEEEVPNVI